MDGFLIISKPKDFTSHDVVNVLKRSFPKTKIGHGGTLDPDATGVLVVCLGAATKLQSYVMGTTKVYESDIVFGLQSPTLDLDGDVEEVDASFFLERTRLMAALERFQGEIDQIPPMVSAIKKDGVPLYKLARKGMDVERESRCVTIHAFEVLSVEERDHFPRARLRITCSAGTYIRALARDIGEALGTVAVADRIVRVASGNFRVEDGVTLEEIPRLLESGDCSFLHRLTLPIEHLPQVPLNDLKDLAAIRAGNAIQYDGIEGDCRIESCGRLLALGRGDGKLVKPYKVLYTPPRSAESPSIVRSFEELPIGERHTTVALGNFDGVHGGHRLLVETMAYGASNACLVPLVCTFSPHPRRLFQGDSFQLLQSDEEKVARLGDAGAEIVFFLPFDRQVANTDPADFVDRYLIEKLRAKAIYIGYNFHFGKGGTGNALWLADYARERGLEVTVIDRVVYGGESVSTTTVKQSLETGNIAKANAFLGYAYSLDGPVVEGRKIGRTIGFPTANIEVSSDLFLPADGVYVAYGYYEGQRRQGVCCIGTRPTIGEGLQRTVEIHLLDDDPYLYGKMVKIELFKKLRDNFKLAGLDELKAQIAKDVAATRAYFDRKR